MYHENLPIVTRSLKEDFASFPYMEKHFERIQHMLLIQFGKQGILPPSMLWSTHTDSYQTIYAFFNFIASSLDNENCIDEARVKEVYAKAVTMFPGYFYYSPIYIENKFSAILGFYQADESSPWTSEEKIVLDNFTKSVSSMLVNKKLLTERQLQGWVFNEMMNKIQSFIYVTDPQTGEILFINDALKKEFHLEKPEGKKCWEVLQVGKKKRCEFCPVPLLMKEDGPSTYKWEHYSPINQNIYEKQDGLMRWMDGRMVHYQFSINITETKRLFEEANYDELTGVFNRRAGKNALQNAMLVATSKDETLVVCMCDLNDLKGINDRHGHEAGDLLITSVVKTISSYLNEQDFIFRLGGDEFAIVFQHVSKEDVTRRLGKILVYLREKNLFPEENRKYEFSFGAIEVPPKSGITMSQALKQADEMLYIQKRAHHISVAEDKAKNHFGVTNNDAFQYEEKYLLEALENSTDDYVYVCNMKTGLFRYSKAMVEEFALPGQVIENAAAVWGAYVHEEDKQAFMESNQEITDGRCTNHSVEYRAKNRHGEWVWVRCRGSLVYDLSGEPTLFAGFITNLGKKNQLDYTTGLPNKYEFKNEVERMLSDYEGSWYLATFDIDQFSRINRQYDQLFGDEVIRIISQKIQSFLPTCGSVYRLDSDEFGIIIRSNNKSYLTILSKLIDKAFQTKQTFENKSYYISISGGCVYVPQDGTTYPELLRNAHFALEYAKLSPKEKIVFFHSEMLQSKQRQLQLMEILRESAENDFKGFEVYYQPIYNLEKQVTGAESLSRFSCEELGYVSPLDFIEIMEKSDLIISYGKWLMEQVIQKCSIWKQQVENFIVTINLSRKQFDDPSLTDYINMLLEKYDVSPRHIGIEITESLFAENVTILSNNIQRIRDLGIRVYMDDFGTGYSSLSILKLAPLDVVKIDRAFVIGIRTSDFDQAFIQLVVKLCHTVGMKVCLEGVEVEEEFQIIKTMNLDYLQGYYLSKPLPAKEYEKVLLASHVEE